jgi:hypothetical protein
MRASTYLSLFFVAVTGASAVVTACANGGSDDGYSAGDDSGLGDGQTGGDVKAMSDGGTRDGDADADGDGGHDVFTCTPTGPSNDCTMAMNLGPLMPGQTMSAMGNIATAGGQAFVSVSFTGNATPMYHPQVSLTEGGAEFAFDVLSDCSGTVLLTCADDEGGEAGGYSTWEEFYADGGDFTNDAFVPIAPSGDDGGVVVRIYRRSGMPLSCNQYALTVSE